MLKFIDFLHILRKYICFLNDIYVRIYCNICFIFLKWKIEEKWEPSGGQYFKFKNTMYIFLIVFSKN